MNSNVNVSSIHTLDSMKAALQTYEHDVKAALDTASRQVHRSLEWLQERRSHWQGEVRRCEATVSKAQSALRSCQNQRSDDRYSTRSCASESAALEKAQVQLKDAQTELSKVIAHLKRVEASAQEYQRQARTLKHILDQNLPRSTTALGRAIDALKAYTRATGAMHMLKGTAYKLSMKALNAGIAGMVSVSGHAPKPGEMILDSMTGVADVTKMVEPVHRTEEFAKEKSEQSPIHTTADEIEKGRDALAGMKDERDRRRADEERARRRALGE